jgi:hypothetical protein
MELKSNVYGARWSKETASRIVPTQPSAKLNETSNGVLNDPPSGTVASVLSPTDIQALNRETPSLGNGPRLGNGPSLGDMPNLEGDTPTLEATKVWFDRTIVPVPVANPTETCMDPIQLATTPEVIILLGAYASENSDVPGMGQGSVHQLSLPVGSDPSMPTLIIMESCYSSPAIVSALDNATDKSNGPRRQAVVIHPKAQLYYDLVRYEGFSASDCLTLPHILNQHRPQGGGQNAAELLNRHFSLEGLDQPVLGDQGGKSENKWNKLFIGLRTLSSGK